MPGSERDRSSMERWSEDALPLVVEGLHKTFTVGGERVAAVNGTSFEVEAGRFYTLLGPSGCGKTTTLRCVAGLERPTGGSIRLGAEMVSSAETGAFVPPHRRGIGMVFQSYGIWPHMSVFANAAFPLTVAKPRPSKAEIREQVEQALADVELGGLEDRPAMALSGGQQQRLALARALVRRPRLLLLDEPLSNLDARLRDVMRTELRQVQRRLGITTLYVTHDQTEALSMSDRIAVMGSGTIVQEGTARELYEQPANRFVAEFVGKTNFIEMTIRGPAADGLTELGGPLPGLVTSHPAAADVGSSVTVAVRPENVMVSPPGEQRLNAFDGKVVKAMFVGDAVECDLMVGEVELTARIRAARDLREGDRVSVTLAPKHCTVVPEA